MTLYIENQNVLHCRNQEGAQEFDQEPAGMI